MINVRIRCLSDGDGRPVVACSYEGCGVSTGPMTDDDGWEMVDQLQRAIDDLSIRLCPRAQL